MLQQYFGGKTAQAFRIWSSMNRPLMISLFVVVSTWATISWAQQGPPPLVPPSPRLSAEARRAINSTFLTDEERHTARVFFGVWSRDDVTDHDRRATMALNEYRLLDEVFADLRVSAEDRGQAFVRSGEMKKAEELLKGSELPRARRLRAEALEWLGEFAQADEVVGPVIEAWQKQKLKSADELTEAARCLIVRARLRGQPARYYQEIVNLLTHVHQRVDRLYWPAKLVEAELLLEKDNTGEAVAALHEVLSLNPRCSDAWYHLGEVAIMGYNFEAVEQAAQRLDNINANHPLASVLRTRSALRQRSAAEAIEQNNKVLSKYPRHREANALRAAIYASQFDDTGLFGALDEFDVLSPNHPYAYYEAGVQLSFDRQYAKAAEVLNEAIRRQPNWAAPQVDLGLMELQAGRDTEALEALRRVAELDPFNMRASFSLQLLEDIVLNDTIISEHFIIRYDPETSDVALAQEMPALLEKMYSEVTAAFRFEPEAKTIIELLPNHKRFGVRITGMPAIHTIAASTGPVVAMESPRVGPNHYGTYDWLRVLRHEFVHTVTLGKTKNRIPHWLTEAAAVWQELAPRDYHTCLALTAAFREERLFDMEEINWAFVRPKRQGDRSLAYAQSHWMFEFFIEQFGHQKMLAWLDAYAEGLTEEDAIQRVTGIDRNEFFADFMLWAEDQIFQWGLLVDPNLSEILNEQLDSHDNLREAVADQSTSIAAAINRRLTDMLLVPKDVFNQEDPWKPDSGFDPVGDADDGADYNATLFPDSPMVNVPLNALNAADLDRLLGEYPMHPDILAVRLELLRIHAEMRGVRLDEGSRYEEMLQLYMQARPVDLMPYREFAKMFLNSEDAARAIPYLEKLDRHEQSSGAFAVELARQYRVQRRFGTALDRVRRAMIIEPFNPNYRELAAAIAIQAKDFEEAMHHLNALSIIEPGRPQHIKRINALEKMLQRQSSEGGQ